MKCLIILTNTLQICLSFLSFHQTLRVIIVSVKRAWSSFMVKRKVFIEVGCHALWERHGGLKDDICYEKTNEWWYTWPVENPLQISRHAFPCLVVLIFEVEFALLRRVVCIRFQWFCRYESIHIILAIGELPFPARSSIMKRNIRSPSFYLLAIISNHGGIYQVNAVLASHRFISFSIPQMRSACWSSWT